MKLVVAFSLLSIFTSTFAQDERDADLTTVTDEVLNMADGEVNYEEIIENYAQLMADPIDLNKARPDRLRLLGILTENQIHSLLSHILTHGKLLSLLELQTVPDFDAVTIEKLLPFVYVSDPKKEISRALINRALHNNNSYVLIRHDRVFQRSKGYSEETPAKRFEGTPDRLYARFRTSEAGDYSVGLTMEKDAGEKIYWAPKDKNYGFDFLSFHAQILNKRKIENLIIGDFQFQFGQGLILGNGFGLGKGIESVASVRKFTTGFLPYTSVNESNYMRGVAVTLGMTPKVKLSAFYSNTWRDGNLNATDSTVTFLAFTTSGLHRNGDEIDNRKTIREENAGVVLYYHTRTLEAGVLFNTIRYNADVLKRPNAYNQFAFNGDENVNTSAFINYTFYNHSLFAEAAKSWTGGVGAIAGIITALSKHADVSFVVRKYDIDFYSFYGNALSENTTAQNETGFVWGVRLKLHKQWSLSSYADLFRFPWLKFRTYSPSTGSEVMGRLTFQPGKQSVIYFQYRQERKLRNSSEDNKVYKIMSTRKDNALLNAQAAITRNLTLKTRLQMSWMYGASTTSGLAISQDISWKINRWRFSARHAIFMTDDFDNRQYSYERDVFLSYSLPAYEGTGVRNFVMAEYKWSRSLSTWVRYSRTQFQDRTVVRSGLDEINGNIISDLRVQIMLRL